MIAVIARMRGQGAAAHETSMQNSCSGESQRLANHKGMEGGIRGGNKHDVKKAGEEYGDERQS